MKRREFIILLSGAAAAWPSAAGAQGTTTVRRLGILVDTNEAAGGAGVAAFRQGLERSGWSEGRNIRSMIFWGEGRADHARAFAAELVNTKPDLILAAGATGLAALLQKTRSIPIVFVFQGDPVAMGLVASMAHPDGNATGFTSYEGGGIVTKWLGLLKEIAPTIRRLLVLNSGNPNSSVLLPVIEKAAGSSGVEMITATVAEPADIERDIAMAARESNVGMMVLPGSFMGTHRELIVALAARHQVPAIYESRNFVSAGGLMSYSADKLESYRQAASYADRILRGEKPGDLPVQAATKFELVINLKTAKALGLMVPPSLLVSADGVIE